MLDFTKQDAILRFMETARCRAICIVALAGVLLGMAVGGLFLPALTKAWFTLFFLLAFTWVIVTLSAWIEMREQERSING